MTETPPSDHTSQDVPVGSRLRLEGVSVFRPYQTKALEEILKQLSRGHSPLLYMETGSGKTCIFCEILKRISNKGKSAIMVVRGRKLVDQASQRLNREHVPHGVFMAGHHGMRVREPIQIASIDTIRSRKARPNSDLIIVDEAHMAVSKSYTDFFKLYPGIPVLSVTATPFHPRGLGHIADVVIRTATFDSLVHDGYLVKPRYFCPSLPDMIGVSTTNGDYNQVELGKKIDKPQLIGDIVSHYLTHANGRKAIVFGVNVHHSMAIAEAFKDVGIKACHCDADTPDEKRQEAIHEFETEGGILCNVGLWGLGVDIPCCDCVILARPTKSIMLFRQQVGRGTRPFIGKHDLLVLDMSGNVLRHGFCEEEIPAILEPEITSRISIKSPTTCMNCYAVFYGSKCPHCGNDNEHTLRKLNIKDGELHEIKELTEEQKLVKYVQELKRQRKLKGYKRGWIYWELKRTKGEEIAERFFKRTPEWMRSKLTKKNVDTTECVTK
jgi:superfamily II DNA or RNA helicase